MKPENWILTGLFIPIGLFVLYWIGRFAWFITSQMYMSCGAIGVLGLYAIPMAIFGCMIACAMAETEEIEKRRKRKEQQNEFGTRENQGRP